MFEAFGAIHSAGEQPGDVAVMPGSTMKQRDVLVDREGRRDRRSELNQLHVLLCVVARQHVAAADSMAPTRLDARGACFVCLPERVPSSAAIFGGRRALRSSARAAFGMASSAPRSTCHLLASSVTASPLAMYLVAVCVTAASVSIHSPSRSAP